MTVAMSDGLGFVATLVVGAAAYIGHVVVRRTKISEFRQQWINDQRIDLAVVASRAKHIATKRTRAGADAMVEFEAAATRITLRENPTKREWDHVIQRVHALRLELRKDEPSLDGVCSHIAAVQCAAQWLLKREWDRVRDGEPGQQRAERGFMKVAIGLGMAAVVYEFWSP